MSTGEIPRGGLISDVAGGRGQSLVAIKRELEAITGGDLGRWILQERKAVLDLIPHHELPDIERIPINLFDPQLVKCERI